VAFITNMNQPLGFAVGNWLEIKECIVCLKGNGPSDLMDLTHELCGAMIWLGKKAKSIEEGKEISRRMVQSGKAWKKFLEIVERQEGSIATINKPSKYPKSKFEQSVVAKSTGFISEINSLEIGLCAVSLGAGRLQWDDVIDPKAGIILAKKVGDEVKVGDKIMTFYTDKKRVITEVLDRLERAVKISKEKSRREKLVYEFLDKSNIF